MAKVGELFAFKLGMPSLLQIPQGAMYRTWGACKAIGEYEGQLIVVGLDWFGQTKPSEADVSAAPMLLAPDWPHHHPGQPIADWRVPKKRDEGLVKVGTCPLTEAELGAAAEPIRAGGAWIGLRARISMVWQWRTDRAPLERIFRSWR